MTIKFLGRVKNGPAFLILRPLIPAMYYRNFNPKIFTDITTPVKLSYSPHTGKKHVIFEVRGGPQDIVSALFFSIEEYRLKCPV